MVTLFFFIVLFVSVLRCSLTDTLGAIVVAQFFVVDKDWNDPTMVIRSELPITKTQRMVVIQPHIIAKPHDGDKIFVMILVYHSIVLTLDTIVVIVVKSGMELTHLVSVLNVSLVTSTTTTSLTSLTSYQL